ncbi:MAG: outer membrane protein assembly factor BamC [Ketobacteraceae bacterium]|nr:outer membrane protein assembly factor BamC [Ketobacteraceae bacterium]
MKYRPLMMLLTGLAIGPVSGCSFLFGNEGYFRSRSMDYQAAEQTRPLVMPPEVEVVARPDIYPIPEIRSGDYYTPEDSGQVPRPESLLSVYEDAGLEMVSDGDQRWLVADRQLAELWEDLALFFKASGVDLEQVDGQTNTMITAWLQPKQKDPEGFWDSFVEFFSFDRTPYLREKFRVRVTAGDKLDQYNVFIDHVRIDTEKRDLPPTNEIRWQRKDGGEELITAMYDELISYLSDDEVRFRRSSLFSQNLTSRPTHLLTRDGNDFPVLVMQQDFNRSWIAVAEALEKSGLTIDDRNRSLGIFYLRYGKNEAGEPQQYQLKLNRAENGIQVAVQISDDEVAPKAVSDQILQSVKENL